MVKIPCIEQKNGVPLPESRRPATCWAAFSKTLGLLTIKADFDLVGAKKRLEKHTRDF